MSDDVTPGARLRIFRDGAGKSRTQLAGLMGCSPESVKTIEVGRRELTLTMAVRAARALGIRDRAALDSAWQIWHTSSKQRTETGKKPCHG